MAQTLRDWYRYLEKQMHVSLGDEQSSSPGAASQPVDPTLSPELHDSRPPNGGLESLQAAGAAPDHPNPVARAAALRRRIGAVVQQDALPVQQDALPMELGPMERRRGGRRPITETREEIIRRLLDPEMTIHEAAAVLNLSKATVRRYTDQGKLVCLRTEGGQRRFRLSALLALLETQAMARDEA